METQAHQRNETPSHPEPSSVQPAVNRHVNLFAPARWTGARAAIVTGWESFPEEAGDGYFVNVQVFLDGERDAEAMQRSRPSAGDWSGDVLQRVFTRLPLYNALDPMQRPATGAWAEWMPYQVGQAAKKEELQRGIARALQAVYELLQRVAFEQQQAGVELDDELASASEAMADMIASVEG